MHINERCAKLRWNGQKLRRWMVAHQNEMAEWRMSIEVADDGGEHVCRVRCSCWCRIGIDVCADHDLEEDRFLQDDLIDDDE